jgi:nucleotide-binding universal stress UspA family protein
MALASRAGAALVLLSARWPNAGSATAQNYLDARAAFLDPSPETSLVLDHEPAAAILLAAQAPDALVCMATHGRGALRKAVLGSVAEEVVRMSPRPVVLVGPSLGPEWELGDAPVVIAGLDGSTTSRAAARAAGDLAASIGARVRAVEVLQPRDVVAVGQFTGGAVDLLEDVVRELCTGGIPAEYEVIDGFDPADALVRGASDRHAAFVAVASHGRSGLARTALGSVSVRVVRHAGCPVLVAGPEYAAG